MRLVTAETSIASGKLAAACGPMRGTYDESPRTTKLYDRTNDAIGLDEIERILI